MDKCTHADHPFWIETQRTYIQTLRAAQNLRTIVLIYYENVNTSPCSLVHSVLAYKTLDHDSKPKTDVSNESVYKKIFLNRILSVNKKKKNLTFGIVFKR